MVGVTRNALCMRAEPDTGSSREAASGDAMPLLPV